MGSSAYEASGVLHEEQEKYVRTTYAVWEITLKCNLACNHCGSRAGDSRVNELNTAEALDLVRQMAEMGIKEVSLIGGEAFLRPDWLEIAKAVTDHGMRATMTTGGYGLSKRTVERMAEAGIRTVSVSVDGLEETHDALRGRKGSFQQAFRTMGYLREVGVEFGNNTQINRKSAAEFPQLWAMFRDAGSIGLQTQFTVPMGNAADNYNILLQPYELLDVFPMLLAVSRKAASSNPKILPGNNIGYYGPYERFLRGYGNHHVDAFYRGCQAGMNVIGIEADGAIKGCPSLPTTPYTGGNIRERTLKDIFENEEVMTFNAKAGTLEGTDHLWGRCKGCEFAAVCRGGCNWTAHVFFGKRGNNPYCIHRALKLASMGLRERFVQKTAASGLPFDHGEFEMIEEPFDAPLPDDPDAFNLDKVVWLDEWLEMVPDTLEQLRKYQQDIIAYYKKKFNPEV